MYTIILTNLLCTCNKLNFYNNFIYITIKLQNIIIVILQLFFLLKNREIKNS